MAEPNNLGYSQQRPNGNEIIRARTTMHVRSWQMPRSQRALQALIKELGKIQYPGVYILFAGKTAYVGEAEHFSTRIKGHIANPKKEIRNWSNVLIIGDGRPTAQSIFNNKAVRLVIEAYLNKLLRANKYKIVSESRMPLLDQSQKDIVDMLCPELDFFLLKKGIITKLLEEKEEQKVYLDELQILFKKKNIQVKKWGASEAILADDKKIFIRPGSIKSKGWQITSRGRKAGSFIDCLEKGEGYLLVNRNGVMYFPLTEVMKVVPDLSKRDTVDIFIVFTDDKVLLKYKNNELDITQFRLIK